MIAAIILNSVFIIYIALDIVFDKQLWEINITLTNALQDNQFTGEEIIFKIFSYSLYFIPLTALFMFLFSKQKLNSLLYGTLIVFVTSLNNLLKLIYHQPRPFMVESNIHSLSCSTELGKPSGHAMGSLIMCFMMPAILFPQVYRNTQEKQTGLFFKISILFILSLWVFMTGLSRIFLGAHTLGQILLGWVYSIYVAIMYDLYIHQKLYQYFKSTLSRDGIGLSHKFVILVFIFTIVWIIIGIIFLELDKEIFISEQEKHKWISILSHNCHYNFNENSYHILYNQCFYQVGVIGVIPGFIFGIKQSKGWYDESQFYKNFGQLTIKQKIVRIIILIILGVLIVPLYIISYFVENYIYIAMFLSILPFCFFGGFMLTYCYSKAMNFFELNIIGDFLYIESINKIKDDVQQEQQMVQIGSKQ